jgi:hypothetical protein
MKRTIFILLLLLPLLSLAGKRYWIGGGTNTGWNASPTTNWSATSGGTTRVAAPTTTDSVYFDGAGANGNTNSIINTNYTVMMFTVSSGYTAQMSHSGYLSVTGNITLHSGYTTNGNTALQSAGAGTITTGGKTITTPFNFVSGAGTRIINGNMTVNGILSLAVNNLQINSASNETITAVGGLSVLSTTLAGTTKIILTGGQWGTGTSASLNNDLDLQGNISLYSGGVAFGSKTLTYVSGMITVGTGTLALAGTPTLKTDGITWYNISLANNTTVTLSSLLIAGSITLANGTYTTAFTGSYGFEVDNLIIDDIQASTMTLANGVTYEIIDALSCYKSRVGSIVLFTSNHASIRANMYLRDGATCNVLASFTRIDASMGRTIKTFNGVITDCVNVALLNEELMDFNTDIKKIGGVDFFNVDGL